MSSYKKKVKKGVKTIMLHLGKLVLKKMMNKFIEQLEYAHIEKKSEEFTPMRRPVERGA